MLVTRSTRQVPFVLFSGLFLLIGWMLLLYQASSLKAQESAAGDDLVQVIVQIDTSQVVAPYMRGATAEQTRQVEIDLAQYAVVNQLSEEAIVNHHYESLPYSVMTVSRDELENLQNADGVMALFENEMVVPSLDSSIPAISIAGAWEAGYDGAGQTIVVLDTGIYADHSFFGGRVVDGACFSASLGTYSKAVPFSETTADSAHSLCPDESGAQYGLGAADATIPTCLNSSGDQICDHGTHVAGIAAGSNDGQGYNGVARGANVIGIQVFTRFNDCAVYGMSSPCTIGFYTDIMAALDYVHTTLQYSYTVASVNMSLGGRVYTRQDSCDVQFGFLKQPIDLLREDGVATIIASGNNGRTDGVSAPACISSAIAVGSTVDDSGISSFSNNGDMVDLLAPGSAVYSSLASGGYGGYNGTSMATPHVAGAWAIARQISPTASIDDILAAFQSTGKMILDTRAGASTDNPLIQVASAMNELATDGVLIVDQEMISISVPPGESVTQTVTVSNGGGLPLNWHAAGCEGELPSWLSLSTTDPITTVHNGTDDLVLQFDGQSETAETVTAMICLQDSSGVTTELTASMRIAEVGYTVYLPLIIAP